MMPAKLIPCALCQQEAAAVYCVNDDANLCTACDASVHSSNPLLARHERRPLAALACQTECASAARTSSTDHADVAVVPQLMTAPAAAPAAPTRSQEQEQQSANAAMAVPLMAAPAPLPAAAPAPLALYEDAFFSRNLQASDMLDFDDDLDLLLPDGGGAFSFDPLSDCVVPLFDATDLPAGGSRYLEVAASSGTINTQQSSFMSHQQPSYLAAYQQHVVQPSLVPLGGGSSAMMAPKRSAAAAFGSAAAHHRQPAREETEIEREARMQRHREKQRKKRSFGRAVRYQSRRAYAEIRPRIKGRFVTPEEYAVYETQAATSEKTGSVPSSYMPPQGSALPLCDEDAVVPMPAYGMA